MLLKTITAILLLIVIIFSGIWLSRIGRPLNSFIFAIHKLVSIAFVVWSVYMFYQAHKVISLQQYYFIILGIACLCLLATLLTGGFLSFDKFENIYTTTIHKVGAVLFIISIVTLLYFLHKLKL